MNALSLRQLNKTYPGGVTALRDINLEVRPGDFYGLLGPNGAGKTTIIGTVASLVRPTSGSVEVFGHDILKDPWQAKSNIGLVPQEFNFNQFETVAQIVTNQAGFYGIDRTTARERAEKYLRELDLWGKRDAPSRQLSGGMKRRLMIARALVHEPRLLILDEPTAGVDIELRRSMWDFLRRMNERGTTIILTTHYLEEAESLCRGIGIIDGGRIVEDTDVRSLLTKLKSQSFVLDVTTPVNSLPALPDFGVLPLDERTIEVEVRGEQTLTELFSALNAAGVEVTSMKNKSNRLEELFVRMLGTGNAEPQSETA
ncbi:ABC transporter ATP-binding protein [Spiribacter aquaticus]|uniref:ABC transporter ATP-binding protein n=1 Tax=Spiribacter aquaticus TaxID=1935996 RepID=A0A557RJW8_9GAMM|nr:MULTISPECIES: ABC transporter ATP-binding protein [Spiribacter]KAF0280014.1 ABC transporter [Spiribacter roseus]TVO65459.1 ABC transporter ATP-binding protein [Spiribacter aquaticus]